jgi:hypothetical protein
MGMFDNIKCEVPLPDGWEPGELQTKDFGCEMVTHIISKEGRLLMDRGHWEEVPKEERPYPDAPEGDIRAWCGSIRRVPKYVDANFHGFVFFGGLEVVGYKDGDRMHPTYKSHDYKAKFTDGQLQGIFIDEE